MTTIRRALQAWGLIVFLLVALIVPATRVQAATGALGFELLGTHPQAAQKEPAGRALVTLQVYGNQIFAGYGNYSVNTGDVDINPFSLSSNTFTGVELTVPTEEIHQWRVINGKLYAPMLDPTCAFNCDAGYASGEPWANTIAVQASHIFDMATLNGSDLWLAGSTELPGEAVAWRSTDGGDTWQVVQTDSGSVSLDGERYYWIAELNGKMYMQAQNIDDYGNTAPVRIFDGTNWTSGSDEEIAPAESRVIVFNDHVITTKNALSAFDGVTTERIESFTGNVLNMYTDDGYLYILRMDGSITRTADLESWQELGTSVPDARSIAVSDGVVYIGDAQARLFGSTLPLPTENPTIAITSPASSSAVDARVNFTVSVTGSNIAKVEYRIGSRVIGLNRSAPYNTSWLTYTTPNGNYAVTARVYDAFGNIADSEPVNITINNVTPAPSGGSGQQQPSVVQRVARVVQGTLMPSSTAVYQAEAELTQNAPTEAQQAEMEQQFTQQQQAIQKAEESQPYKPFVVAGGIAILVGTAVILFFALRRPGV